jgi:hypothetical protein
MPGPAPSTSTGTCSARLFDFADVNELRVKIIALMQAVRSGESETCLVRQRRIYGIQQLGIPD